MHFSPHKGCKETCSSTIASRAWHKKNIQTCLNPPGFWTERNHDLSCHRSYSCDSSNRSSNTHIVTKPPSTIIPINSPKLAHHCMSFDIIAAAASVNPKHLGSNSPDSLLSIQMITSLPCHLSPRVEVQGAHRLQHFNASHVLKQKSTNTK